jgi:predicted hydrocarbon binding protein/predicted nucleic acid-binding protein
MQSHQLVHKIKFLNSKPVSQEIMDNLETQKKNRKTSQKANNLLIKPEKFIRQCVSTNIIKMEEVAQYRDSEPVALLEKALNWYEERVIPERNQDILTLEESRSTQSKLQLQISLPAGDETIETGVSNQDSALSFATWLGAKNGLMTNVKWEMLNEDTPYGQCPFTTYLAMSEEEKNDTPRRFISLLSEYAEELLEGDEFDTLVKFLTHDLDIPFTYDPSIPPEDDEKAIEDFLNDLKEYLLETLHYGGEIIKTLQEQDEEFTRVNPDNFCEKIKRKDEKKGKLLESFIESINAYNTAFEELEDIDYSDFSEIALSTIVVEPGLPVWAYDRVNTQVDYCWECGEEGGFKAMLTPANIERINQIIDAKKRATMLLTSIEKTA